MAKSTSKNNTNTSLVAPERKIEILGVIIIAIALLLGLSIITHHPEDIRIISQLGLDSIFKAAQGPALRIQNGLGPLGAYLSYFFVHYLFGYISLVISVIVLVYGWKLFRHQDLKALHPQAAYFTAIMILFASFLGWLNIALGNDIPSASWSGSAGFGIASALDMIVGPYGPIIIFASLGIIAILFFIDGDIQVTIDRFKDGLAKLRGRMEERKEQKAKEKAEREAKAKLEAEQKEKEEFERKKTEQADRVLKARQQAELKEKEEANKPSIEEIVARSKEIEEERLRQRQQEDKELSESKPRVILAKERKKDEMPVPQKSEDDLEISVYKGEGDEEAEDKEIEKGQKTISKEVKEVAFRFPTLDLLDNPPEEGNEVDLEEINQNKMIILDKLNRHGIEITGIEAIVGPTVTLYELQPAPDVKISKIESYANDLKMAMATHGLRIIAPIPGKSKVGIEVPNRKREMVSIKSVIKTKKFAETKMTLPIAFGRTIENDVFMVDLHKLPHLLVAGATGSGKSVGINTIITCLLYKCHPKNLKFVLVDPKKIELSLYRNIQNHYLATLPDAEEPIITDTSKVLETLNSVCKEMDDRYDLLKMAMVRDIKSYNEKHSGGTLEADLGHRHLPYIVVIIDELADLMMTAGKQIEEPIARIAQLARAVGIHLVVATQRPSVNVITGTIKANFPARLGYRVASKVDSRTILDTMGADQLVGMGDMLFSAGSGMIRVQNAFVSTEEVERITEFIGNQIGFGKPYYLPEIEDESAEAGPLDKSERDDLFEEAAKVVVLHQQGSVSLLQRKLKLGYNRAGRIVDQLFAAGIVGPYQGSTARDVLIKDEDELAERLAEIDE